MASSLTIFPHVILKHLFFLHLFVWNLECKMSSFCLASPPHGKLFIFQVWPQAFTFFCVPLQFIHTSIMEVILLLFSSSSYMFSPLCVKSLSQGHGSDHFIFISPGTQCRCYVDVEWMNIYTKKSILFFFQISPNSLCQHELCKIRTATRKSNRKRERKTT